MPRMRTQCLLCALIVFHTLNFYSAEANTNCLSEKKCTCATGADDLIRAKCGDKNIISLKDLNFQDEAEKIFSLDVSHNKIAIINDEDLKNFTELKRLDVSFNALRFIDGNTFNAAVKLERLKLSHNAIGHIYIGSFDKLKNLKLIDISNNPLVCDCDLIWLLAFSQGHLVKLQPNPKCESPADFKGSLLKKLKVGQDLFCESPLQTPFLELLPKENQIVFEGDSFSLRCRAPRIAIGVQHESEDLPARAHIFWGWSEKILEPNTTEDIVYRDPTKVFNDVQLEARHTTDSAILNSVLQVRSATSNHTGQWDCTLRSQQANLSQSIVVRVISERTQYCEPVTVHTNKGVYSWPKSVQGSIAQQQCVEDADAKHIVTHRCSENATWIDLNVRNCAFVSETTRILEQFAKVNLTLTKANVLDIAQRLHNFTNSKVLAGNIKDSMDLEFIARTLLKYLEHVPEQNEIGFLLLDIISNLMLLPSELFRVAEQNNNSSKKLLKVAEVAASFVQSSTSLSDVEIDDAETKWSALALPTNLYLDYFSMHMSTFIGITCLWFRADANAFAKRSFECTTSNDSFPMFERYIDAALHIPYNLLAPPSSTVSEQIKLMVGVFRNANLMPYGDGVNNSTRLLTSPVIGTQIYEDINKPPLLSQLLNENVTIMLRMHPYHSELSAPWPVWLDTERNVWSEKACQNLYSHRGLLMFSCNRLGYFGLLQQAEFLNHFQHEDNGALFRFLPTPVYYGCAVVFLSCWLNIVTFVTFRRAIHLNRQQRHAFVNTWLAVACLATVFAIGIFQTEWYQRCRIFGLLIHYFSLCVLLWLSVTLSGMYKRLSKRHVSFEAPEMLGPKDAVRPRKPLLGIYLVGWGIAMLICGISSAVSQRDYSSYSLRNHDYSSYSFCFLHTSSSLNAIFVPGVILLLFLAILFVCIYYHINRKAIDLLHGRNLNQHINQQISEHTQATEHIDLDYLGPLANHNNMRRAAQHSSDDNVDRYKSLTLSNPLSSIVDDYERTDISNLRAHFLFLALYLLCWLSAAAFVMDSAVEFSAQNPLRSTIKHKETYSMVFALACSLMSVFLFVFYICSRNDVKNEWKRSKCCKPPTIKPQVQTYSAASHADETITASMAHKPITMALNTDANNTGSRSSSKCSKHSKQRGGGSIRSMKSDERAQRTITTQQLLNAPIPSLINNSFNSAGVNNHAAAAGYSSDIPSAEFFYNPNQINVARKFFKKQKRLAKRNNFELQRQIDSARFDCIENLLSDTTSSTGVSHLYSRRHNAMTLLSGGSKVNNTNIHYRATRHGNYGLLSKECEMPNSATQRPLWSNGTATMDRSAGMIGNIYTNVPETKAPQHETIKLRTLTSRLSPVETLTEQDEESEENSRPLYENASAIKSTENKNEAKPVQCSTPIKNVSVPTSSGSPVPSPTRKTETLLPNDIEAMNCLGLPVPAREAVEMPPQLANNCDSLAMTSDKTDDNNDIHGDDCDSHVLPAVGAIVPKTPHDNLNDALDDDSSQCSIISFFDPNNENST